MYAIVETGAKQYKVTTGDVLAVEKIVYKKDNTVKLDKVLLVSDKKDVTVGKPYIKGAHVTCEAVSEKKGEKTISFKYRRRLGNSRKKIGHRQNYTVLKVKDIVTG
ncbi:MAG: 50S ribosomal protein L21 [Candidatus Omnitrophota bacterium]